MTLSAADFTDYRREGSETTIAEQAAALKAELAEKRFSDTVDGADQQYVDLVMEGGGVLGIALMGYVYLLEQCGIRFLSIAGTSAGAVTALMLAGVDVPARAKSERALPVLAGMPMRDFVDGNVLVRRLIDGFLRRQGWWRLLFKGLRVRSVLLNRLGLNPGEVFESWVDRQLADAEIHSVAELMARMRAVPPGLKVLGQDAQAAQILADEPLCLIAADISTETRVRLPEMAHMYFQDWQDMPPAKLARMSMAVPFFFEPVAVKLDRAAADPAAWKSKAAFPDELIEHPPRKDGYWLPKRSLFVDGGVLSNFPIDAFHDYSRDAPTRPTFGVKLELDLRANDIDGIGDFGYQMFNAARHILDIETIRRNPEFAQLVSFIDTGDHHWLDFDLTDDAKLDLFRRGAEEGMAFLRRFNWEGYKADRRRLAAGLRAMQDTAKKAGVAGAVPEKRYSAVPK